MGDNNGEEARGGGGGGGVVVEEEEGRKGEKKRDMEERKGRVDLAAAYRMCEFYGFNEGVCNHLSYMVDKDTFLVNDYGMAWEEVRRKMRVKIIHGEE